MASRNNSTKQFSSESIELEELIDMANDSNASFSDLSLHNQSNLSELNISDDVNCSPNERDQLIEKLMKLYLRHNLTKIAVEDIAKLMNEIPGATVKMPDTKYTIFQEFIRKSQLKVYEYRFCSKCQQMSKHDFLTKNAICYSCTTNLKKTKISFLNLSVASQLEQIVSSQFNEINEYRKKCNERTDTNIFDVHAGIHLKRLAEKDHFYTLTLNTDGVEIHQSSKSSLWPILLICNFLPPNIRFREKNIIVAGLHYDAIKPDFLHYMEPLAEEFELLGSAGLIIKSECFKFVISHASLDLPAKCALQCITQYNGNNACSYCHHPGNKTSKGIRYCIQRQPEKMRTHSGMISDIQKVLASNTVTVNGIKGLTPMVGFKHFDIVNSFVIDYMHAILLGTVRCILSFLWDTENHKKPFYIIPKNKNMVNRRIALIKPCRFINRRIETFDKYKQFKASQLRHFLLYFYPVLDGFLDKKYYNHLRLLSSSIYILLQTEISETQLNIAKQNLQQFVTSYQNIYGMTNMTMNAHSLTHLVDCVEKMGPLWAYSMFSFESYNGTLKAYASKSNNVINQIVEKVALRSARPEKIEMSQTERLGNEIKTHLSISPCERELINMIKKNDECKFFSTFKRGSVMYTSRNYTKAKKTIDYFISVKNDKFGKVEYFFECSNQNYVVISEYVVEKKVDQFIEVKPRTCLSKTIIKPVNEIIDKYIYMQIGLKEIITKRPNLFEVN